jgi:hypothetical protein
MLPVSSSFQVKSQQFFLGSEKGRYIYIMLSPACQQVLSALHFTSTGEIMNFKDINMGRDVASEELRAGFVLKNRPRN